MLDAMSRMDITLGTAEDDVRPSIWIPFLLGRKNPAFCLTKGVVVSRFQIIN